MILYSPADGDAIRDILPSTPRSCFLMTRLGKPVPRVVDDIRKAVNRCCARVGYTVIDAEARVGGRDLLLKICKMLYASPLAVAVLYAGMRDTTFGNISLELGQAKALGKETIVIRAPGAAMPSDLAGAEYIKFDERFNARFTNFLKNLDEQAAHYEFMAGLLDKNPVLSIDYLRRAYLLTGAEDLREKARAVVKESGLEKRARDSIELLAANF